VMNHKKMSFCSVPVLAGKAFSLGCRIASLLLAGSLILATAGCERKGSPKPFVRPKPAVTFKPQEMADALHAVIAADREVFAGYLEQYRTAEHRANGSTQAAIPAHLLRRASEAIQQKGAEFHYVLRSLWPINPNSGPETATEREGLKFVIDHPDSNFYSEESLGGRRYFTAVYPDRASMTSCVECHNQHKDSPRKDFKQGDIMGGMVVRVPLEF
jgi:Protein of unknown function (DUF3365)